MPENNAPGRTSSAADNSTAQSDWAAKEPRSSRRRLITGGAVLVGGAVLGSQGTADATNGNPWLVGRTTNAESATTKLAMSGNAAAANVTNTNTGTQGHGLLAYSNSGYALLGESTHNQGVVARTHSNTHWAVAAQNLATTEGTGGAIRADGGPNIGLQATSNETAISADSKTGYAVIASTSTKSDFAAVVGTSKSPAGGAVGVWGNGNQNAGVFADTNNPAGSAIIATNNGGQPNGNVVRAFADSSGQAKISKLIGSNRAAGEFVGTNGVVGVTSNTGYGVAGAALANAGHGLHGYGDLSAGAYALVTVGKSAMLGDLSVFVNLSKPAGSFKIDHPLDPANKYLYHSFVESPDMKNVYDGVATADAHGAATVELPDWFETLNRDFRYQLTALDGAAPELHVSKRLHGNRFSIGGAKPGQDVSWQLTGIRHDSWANDHRIPVEETKPKDERGTYLHPEGFAKPASAGLAARMSPHQH